MSGTVDAHASNGRLPAASSYRAYIDGLRAVAVLAVLAFHLRGNRVPGGFAGVDVFFVISGFLITSQILAETTSGRFSYAEFYRRRVRRIAPAMLIVVLATVVAAQLLLLPEDTAATTRSALWSIAGLANVWFWRHLDTGYFAEDSATVPLLHLWSLGIEEQFYLLWPPMLRLLVDGKHRPENRERKHSKPGLAAWTSLVVVASGSYALGSALAPRAPAFAYYMLPTRAGELLLGSLLAIFVRGGAAGRVPPRVADGLGIVGLLSIGASFLLLSGDDTFPGWLALPPTLGAALVILSGEAHLGPSTKALSVEPLVRVGLLSYSIYLWHWPFIAFWRYGHGSVGRFPTVGIVIATFAAAWATRRWIEEPARAAGGSAGRVFTRLYALPAAAVSCAAALPLLTSGYGLRVLSGGYPAALSEFREATRLARMESENETDAPGGPEMPFEVVGPEGAAETVLLWGDSNASHFVGMLSAFAEAVPFRFRHVSVHGCPGVLRDPPRFALQDAREKCRRLAPAMRSALGRHATVVMANRWSRYTHQADFLDAVAETVASIRATGARVVLVGETAEMTGFDRRCLEKALGFPGLDCKENDGSPIPQATIEIGDALRDLAKKAPGVGYWDPNEILCPAGRCSAFGADGAPLFRDPRHLSPRGSRALGDTIIRSSGVPAAFRDTSPSG